MTTHGIEQLATKYMTAVQDEHRLLHKHAKNDQVRARHTHTLIATASHRARAQQQDEDKEFDVFMSDFEKRTSRLARKLEAQGVNPVQLMCLALDELNEDDHDVFASYHNPQLNKKLKANDAIATSLKRPRNATDTEILVLDDSAPPDPDLAHLPTLTFLPDDDHSDADADEVLGEEEDVSEEEEDSGEESDDEDVLDACQRSYANKRQRTEPFKFVKQTEQQDEAMFSCAKPYQFKLAKRVNTQLNRGKGFLILHTMGMGKSLSFLISLQLYLNTHPTTNAVMLCPTTMVGQWVNEVAKWSHFLTLTATADTANTLQPGVLHVLTYDAFKHFTLEDKDILAVDEAHNLKNEGTQYRTLVERSPATRRVLLSGTPIQNCVQEYVSMINLVSSTILLNSKALLATIQKGLNHADHKPRFDAEVALATLNRMARDHLDIQTKLTNVVGKREFVVHRPLPHRELPPAFEMSKRYADIIETIDDRLDLAHQIISHARAKDESVIVFSSSLSMHEHLSQTLLNEPSAQLHGKLSKNERATIIDKFQRDGGVLLCSLKLGEGLTLTKANHVVLFEPYWNPAPEMQAIARAYRMGQDLNVRVYRLVVGPIDECMYMACLEKRKLQQKVLYQMDTGDIQTKELYKHKQNFQLFQPCREFHLTNATIGFHADHTLDEQVTSHEVEAFATNNHHRLLIDHKVPRWFNNHCVPADQTHFNNGVLVPPFPPAIDGKHFCCFPLFEGAMVTVKISENTITPGREIEYTVNYNDKVSIPVDKLLPNVEYICRMQIHVGNKGSIFSEPSAPFKK